MTQKRWETIKVRFCDHAECEVELQIETVPPPEYLPDQPARILSHRCSRGVECSMFKQPACRWAGTNPEFDPFEE